MARCWLRSGVGLAAITVAGLGGCGPRAVLDPAARPPGTDGAVVSVGGPAAGDGGVAPDAGGTPGDGSAAGTHGPDGGGSPATDAGGIITSPPISACALSPGRLPVAPANRAGIGVCGAALRFTDSMSVGPGPDGQSYQRCGTLGPETSWRVTLSLDASHLAARTAAGTVRLYRTDSWQEIAQLASPVGTLDAAAFSPDGARLATLSGEMGRLTIWNVADGARLSTYDMPTVSTIGNPSSALAFSSDGRRIATSLRTVVDLQTGGMTAFDGKPVAPYSVPVNPADHTDFPTESIDSLRFVGCDQRLLIHGASAAGMSGWVEGSALGDPVSGAGTGLGGDLWGDLGGIVASPDGRWVALAQRGPSGHGLYLYDAAAGSVIASDPNAPHLVAGFSRAGDRLFVVTDTAIQVRQVPTLRLLVQSALPSGSITAATISPRDEVIVSIDGGSTWIDPNTGAVRHQELFAVADAEFSADGRFGVAGGDGRWLFELWSESDRSVPCAPAAATPDAAIAGFAASQDGRTLALVDVDGLLQVRAVDGSRGVGPPWTTVQTGVFGPNGVKVAVANGGGRVAVQGSPTASPARELSRLVVVDTANGTPLLTRDIPRVTGSLALSPDGAWVAFQDGDYTSPSPARALSVASGATALSVSGGQIDSFSPNSDWLAVAANGAMQVWDLASGVQANTYSLPGLSTYNIALSPDWSMMGGWVEPSGTGWDQQAVLVWRPQDGTVVQQIGKQLDVDGPPRFDTSNTVVAGVMPGVHTLGTNWDAWHVWSVADGTVLRVFPMSSRSEPLAFLPGGSRLLTRAGTGVAVWCR